MKLTFFTLSLIILTLNMNAQIGINTTTPESSSILDISTIDKGILIPRVTLQSTTDKVTIENPANSLLVFNEVAANDILVGYYYWHAVLGKWIKFLDELDKPGVLFATFDSAKTNVYTTAHTGTIKFNFTNITFNSITGASMSGTSLTLPPGNYMIDSDIDIRRDFFEYILNVNNVATGIKGTIATVKTQAEVVSKGQQAVFTLTTTSIIDFIPLSNQGGATIPVDPTISYLKIVKF